MRHKIIITLLIVVLTAAGFIAASFMPEVNIAVLNPKGAVALQQRDLMIITTLLMLVVVIPVFVLTFMIAWKYRAGNKKATYTPEWDHSKKLETLWWTIPLLIITIISALIYVSTHKLDPYKPLASNEDALTVQVVALQWKWLFLYPEQGIATVNHVQFPEDKPVNFQLTADAPMNSFWIPQLGGQIYAMAGMTTRLHLIANETGMFNGSSANLSGEGFAGMKFTAQATTQQEFDTWVQATKRSPHQLDASKYEVLQRPSKANEMSDYAAYEKGLYDTIVMKYMGSKQHSGGNNGNGAGHDTAH